jgi:hypothetical protein
LPGDKTTVFYGDYKTRQLSRDSQAINFMRLATGKQHRQFTPGNETQGSNQMKYRQGIGRGPVQAIMARVASKQPLDP